MPTLAEGLAHSLVHADARVITHVPGHGATETFRDVCRISGSPYPVSFHEEVAYTIAHGAAVGGTRSATLLKSHGIAKAANSLIDSLFCGTTAGMVNIVFDDAHGRHSDSIFDIDTFLAGCGIPFTRVDKEDAATRVAGAFAESEDLSLPIALVVEAGAADDVVPDAGMVNRGSTRRYQRDIARHLVCPLFSGYQRDVLSAKLTGQRWNDIRRPVMPRVPDFLPEPWRRAAQRYVPFFDVFQSFPRDIVTGDTGTSSLFALPPFECVDVTTYMGGSVPLAIGAQLAGHAHVWALSGDFSFIAAGHLGLAEALERGVPLKVIIFDNGVAEATGGQPVEAWVLERVLRGYREYVRTIDDPLNADAVRAALVEAESESGMRIVVLRYRS